MGQNGEVNEDLEDMVDLINSSEQVEEQMVINITNKLPPVEDEDFYRDLSLLLNVNDQQRIKTITESILSDDTNNGQQRFICFYYLASYYRRRHEYDKLADLHQEYREEFENQMYELLYIHYLNAKNKYTKALEKINGLVVDFDRHKEVLHTHANILVSYLEDVESLQENEEEVKKAQDTIEEVLELDDEYARYHYTKARILTLQKEFEQARSELNMAIELENADRSDYEVRMSMYYSQYPEIYAKEFESKTEDQLLEIERRIDNAQKRADDMQARFVQFIGFFTGILAIIVVFSDPRTLQTGFSFRQTIQYLLILIGGLLFAFGGLGLLLPTENNIRNSTALFITSGMIIIIALIVVPVII